MSERGAGVALYCGEALARYGFGEGHPFGPDRLEAFMRVVRDRGLDARVHCLDAVEGTVEQASLSHLAAYVRLVEERSRVGTG
jgi:acetoin utilization protein AcuC